MTPSQGHCPANRRPSNDWTLLDLAPATSDLRADALAGLRASPKRLSSKYFYDARGSRLFEAITRQPEYYLTRVETTLLQAKARQIAARIGPRVHVVEPGTGSGAKTRLLLESLDDPVAYTAVEISRTALVGATEALAAQFPRLQLLPVCADFTQPVPLPRAHREASRTLVFFPGSTLGNFDDADAVGLLRSIRQTMGTHGLLLLGLDLVKAPSRLEAAYNDAAGVTAEFTLNLLSRLNREAGGGFDLNRFAHHAVYSTQRERIETAIVSRVEQTVPVAGEQVHFAEGERIEVEISRKYSDASIRALSAQAGLDVIGTWKDEAEDFALVLLRDAGPQAARERDRSLAAA
jgi:L-histidine Nalpha-methyltransferase